MASLPFDLYVYSRIRVCRSMALYVRLYSCQMVKTGCMYLCADIVECTSVCARYLLRALSISSLFSMHNYTQSKVSARTFAHISRLLADFSRNCSMTNQLHTFFCMAKLWWMAPREKFLAGHRPENQLISGMTIS